MQINKNWPDIVQQIYDGWDAPVVARSAVGQCTGGMLSPKTLANEDCRGIGPAEKVLLNGKKVGYPLTAFCDYLSKRLQTVPAKSVKGDVL